MGEKEKQIVKDEAPLPVHVLEFIDDELKARGWTRWDLAERMGDDPPRDVLALQLLELHDPHVLLGEESAQAIGRAFGTGSEIWTNLDNTWRTAINARLQKHAGDLYIALRSIFWDYEDDCGCERDGPTCCAKVNEQCAKCDARAAINLIEDPYASPKVKANAATKPKSSRRRSFASPRCGAQGC